MLTLVLAAALSNLPATADLEPPPAALTGPSSTRLALPVAIRFDDSLNDDVSKLISKDDGTSAAVWGGEQMVAKARADAEAAMKKAQAPAKKK